MMTETLTAQEFARVESTLQSLSAKLSALNKAVDDGQPAQNFSETPETFGENISGDVSDFKAALQKIRDGRRDFYRRVCAQSRESKFNAIDELRRLAEVLEGLTSKTAELNAQCEKLDRTRSELETFSASNTLDETLKNFSDKLSTLGTCDEKIREATAEASSNLDNLKSALDEKISEALDLEREFLITCRELAGTTKSLEQNLNAVEERQLSAFIDAVNSLADKLNVPKATSSRAPHEDMGELLKAAINEQNAKFQNINALGQRQLSEIINTVNSLADKFNVPTKNSDTGTEREKFFNDLFVKINNTVFSPETRELGIKLAKVNSDQNKLSFEALKAIKPYVEIINSLTRLFKQVKQILNEAATGYR